MLLGGDFLSKYISFSFDDARWDTKENAIPVLEKYGFSYTLNVISDFVLNPETYNLANCAKGSMTSEDVLYVQKTGNEIACHGHTHNNSVKDITDNINALKKMGVNTSGIGFASPHSVINESNIESLSELLDNGTISYIRSGIQIKKQGLMCSALTWLERKTHSKRLFYYLNKKCIFNSKKKLYLAVGITKHTTVDQIMYLIDKMQEEDHLILMYHSILKKEDSGREIGNWFWDYGCFNSFCEMLSRKKECLAITDIKSIQTVC